MDNIDLNKKLLDIMTQSLDEGRMSDIHQDANSMSKEEFAKEHPMFADDYEGMQHQDDPNEPSQEEMDKHAKKESAPYGEPSQEEEMYNTLITAYENGEEDLAEVLGLSMEELDQEMTEFAMDHNLHMDDDRDEVMHGYIEDVVHNADFKDHGEYESVEEDEVQVDELAMPCGAEETSQVEQSVEFRQHKNTDRGSVTIEASADDMQELAKVLKLAGLTLPKDMNYDQDPIQPASDDPVVVVPDAEDGDKPTMNFPKTDVDPNMSQDKAVLTSVIRDKLRDYLKNSQR